jgi:hypothetical protein
MPGTGLPEAQKEERQERAEFKNEPRTLQRTGRNRGIVVSGDCPWLKQLEKERSE